MTYKAQLVVRARSKDGADIIDKVKEMASDQDKTYSEMAVELLGRGLNADEDVEGSFGTDQDQSDETDDAEPVESTESDDETTADEPDPEPVVTDIDDELEEEEDEPDPRAPLPPEEAGPPVDPELPPEKIIDHYVDRLEERGERAAGRILVDFFTEAGPAEGGELKDLLQEEFTQERYDELMEPIKNTDEYKEYTERAIFGEPSPYSEAN